MSHEGDRPTRGSNSEGQKIILKKEAINSIKFRNMKHEGIYVNRFGLVPQNSIIFENILYMLGTLDFILGEM